MRLRTISTKQMNKLTIKQMNEVYLKYERSRQEHDQNMSRIDDSFYFSLYLCRDLKEKEIEIRE